MPNSKAKKLKLAKLQDLRNQYFDQRIKLPNFKRKRDESPNTAANRNGMREEMKRRNMLTGDQREKILEDFKKSEQQNGKLEFNNNEMARKKMDEFDNKVKFEVLMNARERRAIKAKEKREKFKSENPQLALQTEERHIQNMERLKNIKGSNFYVENVKEPVKIIVKVPKPVEDINQVDVKCSSISNGENCLDVMELVNIENISLDMVRQQHFKLRLKYRGNSDKIQKVNEAFEKLKKLYF